MEFVYVFSEVGTVSHDEPSVIIAKTYVPLDP